MKRLFVIVFSIGIFSLGSASCSPEVPIESPETEQPSAPDKPNNPDNDDNNNTDSMNNKLKITVGTASFTATLYDNAAVAALKAMLPLTVNMSETNGNEKLYYLSSSLPTSTFRPGSIRSGDLMLWGSDCLVLFYKSFSSSYSYTRIGRVDDASGLEAAVGSGSVTVTFEQPKTDTQ